MTGAAERGKTAVSDRAVRKIAGRAAGEVASASVRTGAGSASVRGRRADVGVKVALPFPAPLPEAARLIQDHVTSRTQELTGLHVSTAQVHVTGLLPVPATRTAAEPATGLATTTAADDPDATHRDSEDSGSRTPLRWWSPRRLPTALLALAAATACGALAVDMIRVHLAHRPAASWRADTVHWLERHGPDAPFVGIAAGALALVGILMIALALSPGRRGLLTMTSPAAHLRVAMDRTAIALVVRDAVGDVPGVGAVRVRVRRRRVVVRAQLAFGDRAIARRDILAAAHGVLDGCCLRRPPGLRVKVQESHHQKGRATDAP
ncbi:DUF6286 domain-containing protein [Streptomyces endophyticus]|uniref:Asp23/Gls24 family envelope stress response protein n=1 Tax=Streptomyces endophyticus TaxID=714166 RepID=A0ABU6F0N7_9ACTN|nr:DUF6286 domain-containing protein [Streptomyces endophyticus]MEB8337565.1 Asp23/Gls24 family envelope stress response protein [Streptomyces endophyticus]